MPVVLKRSKINFKDSVADKYIGVDVITDKSTAEQIADIENAGTVQIAAIEAAAAESISYIEQLVSDSQTAVNELESQKNTIAQTVASMAQLGTDTTLSTPGMAADAASVGELKDSIEEITGGALDDKADKTDTVLETTLSRGRSEETTIGEASMAFGNNVEASGQYAIALGGSNKATGSSAFAAGMQSTASGFASVAAGMIAMATGTYSHAEGYLTKATGNAGSHAEGTHCHAEGASSHAEGDQTVASGHSGSHAEGSVTTASGYCSHAEGHQTIANSQYQHVFGDYNIEDPNTDVATKGTYIEIVGNGTKDARSNARTLDWNGNEQLAGDLTINYGTENEVSVSDLAEEISKKYEKPDSGIPASDIAPNVIPDVSEKADKADTVLETTLSRGRRANTAVGTASFAFGAQVEASGMRSHAEGYGTVASSLDAHAEGMLTKATGERSHSEGNNTIASGDYSHAENQSTTASGEQSHSEGLGTIANAKNMHAQGQYNAEAVVYPAWARRTDYNIGDKCVIARNGYICTTPHTSGDSEIMGYWQKIIHDSDTAFVVGNGMDEDNRSNALEVDWSGNEWIAGNMTVAGGKLKIGNTTITETQLQALLALLS